MEPEQELTPQWLTDKEHNPVLFRHLRYDDMTDLHLIKLKKLTAVQ